MKIQHLIVLTACAGASGVYAADNTMLPPVLDSSTAYRSSMLQPVANTYTPPSVTTPAPSATYSDPVTYQLTTRLDQLQTAVVQMQSKVNQQSVAINNLQQSQNVVNANVQKRLNDLTARQLGSSTPITPIVTAPAPITSNTSPFSPTAYPPLTTTNPTLLGEKERYQNAYTVLRAGNFDQAITEFQGLLKDHPNGEYADNAHYWIGEAKLVKGDKQGAMQSFDKVVQSYPKSNKVPDALLKLGFVQLGLNNRIKAKEYLDYVIVAYPGTTAAKLAMQKKAQAAL